MSLMGYNRARVLFARGIGRPTALRSRGRRRPGQAL